MALLPLVCHEGWQRVELLLTLPTQEHVLVICKEGKAWGLTQMQQKRVERRKSRPQYSIFQVI